MVLMVGGGEERVYLVYKPGAGEEEGGEGGRRALCFLARAGEKAIDVPRIVFVDGVWVKSRSMYQERLSTRFGNIVVYANESK